MKKVVNEYRGRDLASLNAELLRLLNEVAFDKIAFASTKPKDTNLVAKKMKKIAVIRTLIREAR